MEENIFDLVNNFDSFEESFDGIGEENFTDSFDEMNDDLTQNHENGFFGEEENCFLSDDNGENSFFGNDETESNNEDLDSEPTLGSSLGGFFSPTPVWKKAGIEGIAPNCGAHDDYDHDGWENWEDNYDGPGRYMYDTAKPHVFGFLGSSLDAIETAGNDYEDISFTDIFSDLFPDFMPDPISSPQDGSTDFDRAVDNFFEMLDPGEHYHCQEAPNSCAVAVQTDILNDFGINVSEAELRDLGEDLGVFTESGGTPLEDVGKLLEHFGIEVERGHHFDLEDLMEAKANGEKVIIGLDAAEIWNDPSIQDHPLERMSGGFVDIPTAGHAVEFKGVVEDIAGNHYVVLDDPGHPYGHNVRIPLEDFDDAWDDFGHFAVITNTH